jgi:hypothetical protein
MALFASNVSTLHLVSLAQNGFDTGLPIVGVSDRRDDGVVLVVSVNARNATRSAEEPIRKGV